jgi:hypothetical protein
MNDSQLIAGGTVGKCLLFIVHVLSDTRKQRGAHVPFSRVSAEGDNCGSLGRRLGDLQCGPNRSTARDSSKDSFLSRQLEGSFDCLLWGNLNNFIDQFLGSSILSNLRDEVRRPTCWGLRIIAVDKLP